MDHRQELLNIAEDYCKVTGRGRSALGLTILGDSKFFNKLEQGRSCRLDTYERVISWFKENSHKESRASTKKQKSQ